MAADPNAPSAESSTPESLDAPLPAALVDEGRAEAAAAVSPPAEGTGEIRIIEESDDAPAEDVAAITAASPAGEGADTSASRASDELGATKPDADAISAGEPEGATAAAETAGVDAPPAPAAHDLDDDAPAGDVDAGPLRLTPAESEAPRDTDLPVFVKRAEPATEAAGAAVTADEATTEAPDESTMDGEDLAAAADEPPAPPPAEVAPDPEVAAAAAEAALLDSLVLRPSGPHRAATEGAQPSGSMSLQDASDDRTVISDPPPGVLAASAEGVPAVGLATPIFGSGVLVDRPRRVQLSYVQLGLLIVGSALAGGALAGLIRGDHVVAVQAATIAPAPPAATTANVVPLPPPPVAAPADETPAKEGAGSDADDAAQKAAAHAKKAPPGPRRARKPAKKGWTDPFGP
jgi:hypothetical protein